MRPRAVIIGGGVVGLASAWYLLRDGWQVSIVERGPPEHDSCSLGNAGLVTPSHFVPLAAPGVAAMALRSVFTPRSAVRVEPRINFDFLRWGWKFLRAANARQARSAGPLLRDFCLLSRECYTELDTAWNHNFGFERRGVTMLVRDARHLAAERQLALQARQLGLVTEELSAAELAARHKGLRLDVLAGMHFPIDSHLDPNRLNAELTARLREQGAEFLWHTEACGWRLESDRVAALRTNRGELQADEFILAAGSWTPMLATGLDLRLMVEPGKGYSLSLPAPPAMPAKPLILVEARIAVTPLADTLRFAGTMQFAGRDLRLESHRSAAMIAAVSQYLPDFPPPVFAGVEPWAGLRPVTPDGLPLLGRAPRQKNLTIATGHAMIGVTLAPATGLLVAQLLGGRPTSLPLDWLRPERFS